MAKVKGGLGRGLNALIPQGKIDFEEIEASKDGIMKIDINEIKPNASQPRKIFDQEKLDFLVESIKVHGIIQPVIVRSLQKGYELVAGERRWRAARQAGLKQIPCIIKDLNERQRMEVALVENLQREDLNPIEEAEAYKILADTHQLTQDEISSVVGKSRPYVANSMRLLNLPKDVQKMIKDQELTPGHARALLRIENVDLILELAKTIKVKNLSVREAEELVAGLLEKKEKSILKQKKKDSTLIHIEDILKGLLGTKVNIVKGKKKGKIEIEYYGDEELERLVELIQGR